MAHFFLSLFAVLNSSASHFSGSILVFSQKEDLLQANQRWAKYFHRILPWTPAGHLHISCSEIPGINLHGTVKMHTEETSSTQTGKSKDHSRKINLNLLVSFILIPCTSSDRYTQYFISSSDLLSALFLWLYLFPLLSGRGNMGKKYVVSTFTWCGMHHSALMRMLFLDVLPLSCPLHLDPLF